MAEKDGPVYLLSLDGGGIRGICELIVLDKIMRRIQEEQGLSQLPRPCDYFHLIGGVSTGGLISIMLGRLQMTTTAAIASYHDFGSAIFGLGNMKFRREIQAGVKMDRTWFGTKELERIIKEMVENAGQDPYLLNEKGSSLAKAFVCTQSTEDIGSSSVVLLRSYRASSSASLRRPADSRLQTTSDLIKSRSVDSSKSIMVDKDQTDSDYTACQIWQAARATSAATPLLAPVPITSEGGKTTFFVDAAIGCNNPVKHVLSEAAAVFGVDRKLGCLLSLGTGRVAEGQISVGFGGILSVAKAAFKHLTTSETNNQEMQKLFASDEGSYFRLSLPMDKKVSLKNHKLIKQLAEDTKKYIAEAAPSILIEKVVQTLLGNQQPKFKLGQVAGSDHGQFQPKKFIQGRPATSSFFIGRQDILHKLAAHFVHDFPVRRQALIWAQGGAGKTQTASRFLDEYGDRFDKTLWVDATDDNTLIASYTLIAEREGLSLSSGNIAAMVLNWLAVLNDHWILVLDNARGDVSKYVPHGTRGCLLFTSRNKDFKPRIEVDDVFELGNLTDEDAVTLLLKVAHMDSSSPQNRREAAEIVRDKLAYLPLAIDQAASHIRRTKIKLAVFVAQFENHQKDLLRRRPGTKFESLSNPAIEAVHVSFEVTYEALHDAAQGNTPEAHDAKNALRLLSAFSFYANEGLIGDVFKRAAERRLPDRTPEQLGAQTLLSLEPLLALDPCTKQWNINAFSGGVLCLESCSLIKATDGGSVFSIHALVHEWARERTSDRERMFRAEAARRLLFDSYVVTREVSSDWVFNRRLMPHMKFCLDYTNDFSKEHPLHDALHRSDYATMLLLVDRPYEVLKLVEPPMAILAAKDKGFTYEYWHCLDALSQASLALGMLEQAERLRRQLLRIADRWIEEGYSKPHDIMILDAKVVLADILAKQSKIYEAETLLLEIIGIGTTHHGDGGHLLHWMSTLEILYSVHGRWNDARPIAEKLLKLSLQLHGADHPLSVDGKRNLGRVYLELQRFSEAKVLAFEVLEWEEKQADAGCSVETINKTRTLMADILYGTDHFEESYDLYSRVVRDLKAGPQTSVYDGLPGAYQGMGQVAIALGRYEAGLTFGRLAFQYLFDSVGPSNVRTRQACATLIFWINCGVEADYEVEGPKWDEFWEQAAEVEPWPPAAEQPESRDV